MFPGSILENEQTTRENHDAHRFICIMFRLANTPEYGKIDSSLEGAICVFLAEGGDDSRLTLNSVVCVLMFGKCMEKHDMDICRQHNIAIRVIILQYLDAKCHQ